MKLLIGSSYFAGGKGGVEFRERLAVLWSKQIAKCDIKPSRTVIICEASSLFPKEAEFDGLDLIRLTGDCGHCGALLNGSKKNEFSGWSASMLACAMTAYCDEADFLYVEQDALCFGPWVQRMYDDMGDACMVFGPKHTSEPWMPCSQSVFLVRNSFIPTFVRTYLGLGRDGDVRFLGEQKFVRIEEQFGPSLIRKLSFGVDRCRPIPWDQPVFYAQQWTQEEIDEAIRRGLL